MLFWALHIPASASTAGPSAAGAFAKERGFQVLNHQGNEVDSVCSDWVPCPRLQHSRQEKRTVLWNVFLRFSCVGKILLRAYPLQDWSRVCCCCCCCNPLRDRTKRTITSKPTRLAWKYDVLSGTVRVYPRSPTSPCLRERRSISDKTRPVEPALCGRLSWTRGTASVWQLTECILDFGCGIENLACQ